MPDYFVTKALMNTRTLADRLRWIGYIAWTSTERISYSLRIRTSVPSVKAWAARKLGSYPIPAPASNIVLIRPGSETID